MTQPALALSSHSVRLASEIDFEGWRDAARTLALAGIPPEDIEWLVDPAGEHTVLASPPVGSEFRVARDFVDGAQTAILHSDPQRFAFLYRLLWRLRAEPNLMRIASDPDIRQLEAMQKAIRRDIHKMRAFVRFRKSATHEHFVAWFEPRISSSSAMRLSSSGASPACAGRSSHTYRRPLGRGNAHLRTGRHKSEVPPDDAAEELWRTYFRNIFNPARLKVKAMQAEMPKKYWRNLPEAVLIPALIGGADKAPGRWSSACQPPGPHHAKRQRTWPTPETPAAENDRAAAIDGLRGQAAGCRRCPLWRDATQTVFGEGPEATVVFVGEQPGDQEDIAGEPFVGPAGKVFDAMHRRWRESTRDKTYVTNAVKHFKFEPRGKRRIHAKPNAGEVLPAAGGSTTNWR